MATATYSPSVAAMPSRWKPAGDSIGSSIDSGAHTNHYQSDLAELAPPASEESLARLERLQALLTERDPQTPEDLMDVMRDHDSDPQAVCLHPDPDEGDEASACLFSMVVDVETGRMWVAPGNPCEHEYQEIDLSEMRA